MNRALACLTLLLFCGASLAHKPSDSYLQLRTSGAQLEGQWDIALRDLDHALGLDTDHDGAITWGELRRRHADIADYTLARLEIRSDRGDCSGRAEQQLVDEHSDGAYAVLRFQVRCPAGASQWSLRYRLFFDLDPQHRGLLHVEHLGRRSSGIFSPDHPLEHIGTAQAGQGRQFLAYLRDGVHHIWVGYDHLLFLLCLLLPAVLRRGADGWLAVERFRDALIDVIRIVTAFTVAHSITLSLAVFGLVALPSRWVESAIAASVLLAALNNLHPLVRGRRWIAALVFGLVHGLGFANVLIALGLPPGTRLLSLLGFNLGVELGQLAVVGTFLPLAYLLRRTRLYRLRLVPASSALIALLACVWLLQRGLDLDLSVPYAVGAATR